LLTKETKSFSGNNDLCGEPMKYRWKYMPEHFEKCSGLC
jgi:hypothetical protein